MISKLKTLTWNLQDFFIFLDKYNGEDLTKIQEPKWQLLSSSLKDQKPIEKVRAIASLIINANPDICFFTEIGGKESLENFNKFFLDSKYQVIHFDSNSDRGIDMGVLLRPEIPYEAKFHNDKVFARGVLELKVNTGEYGLHYLLTHLKSKLNLRGKDFEGRTQRQAELKQIGYICQKIRKTKNCHPILVGDLNGIIDSSGQDFEVSQFANKLGLKDGLDHLKKSDFDRFTYIYYNKQAELIRMQLDYCLMDEVIAKFLQSSSQVLDFTGEKRTSFPTTRIEHRRNPSDHYPLLINLDFT